MFLLDQLYSQINNQDIHQSRSYREWETWKNYKNKIQEPVSSSFINKI